jgi:hypothetical protein
VRDPAVFYVILSFEKFEKDRQRFQRINDRQKRSEHANKERHLLLDNSSLPKPGPNHRQF